VGIVWALSTRLNAPLGSRVLMNPDTSQALAWFDESRTLQPTKLPAGYTLAIVSPALSVGSHLTGCMRVFDDPETADEITITQQMGVVQPPSVPAGATSTAILVRGQEAVVDQTSDEIRISWYEDGQTMTVSAGPAGMFMTEDLVAMVESAP
jgi:hypothetical protein